jgi:hypothetical protein
MVNRGALILFSAILLLTGFTCEKTKYKLLTAKSDSCLMAQKFLIESDKKEMRGWTARLVPSKYFCDATEVNAINRIKTDKERDFRAAVRIVPQESSCEILIAVGYTSRDFEIQLEEKINDAKEFLASTFPGSFDYKIVDAPTPEQDPMNWCKK